MTTDALIATLPADLQAHVRAQLHNALAVAFRRYTHGTDAGAERVAALISPETLARMLAARAPFTE